MNEEEGMVKFIGKDPYPWPPIFSVVSRIMPILNMVSRICPHLV